MGRRNRRRGVKPVDTVESVADVTSSEPKKLSRRQRRRLAKREAAQLKTSRPSRREKRAKLREARAQHNSTIPRHHLSEEYHPACAYDPIRMEIVAHCWNYARAALYQLSSLVLYPPKVPIQYTLYYSKEDTATVDLKNFFSLQQIPNVYWCFRAMHNEAICRRAIGRNLAALDTKADWVWFVDVDMVFGPGSIDQLLYEADQSGAVLCYPGWILKSSHERGDQLIEEATGHPRIISVDPREFLPHKYNRAIGGVQIVEGDICRELGYCRDKAKFQTPVVRWRRTFEDKAVRAILKSKGPTSRLSRVNVYRISHSKQGRFHPGLVF